MKLSSTDVQHLNNILNTCAIAGIEAVLIDEGVVRGINEGKTAVLISDLNVPAFPQKVAFTRLSSLRNRIALFSDSLVIDAKESDRGEINSLEMASGKSKAQFRCTPTMLVKPPKIINDEDFVRLTFSKDELKTLLNASKVMGSKKIAIMIKSSGEVSFSASDESNDVFTSSVDAEAEFINDASTIYHDYPTDILSAVLKKASDDFDTLVIIMGEAGTMTVKVNGHNVTVLPMISDNDD